MVLIADVVAPVALDRDGADTVGVEQRSIGVADAAVAGAQMDSNVAAADAGDTMAGTVLADAEPVVADAQPVANEADRKSVV